MSTFTRVLQPIPLWLYWARLTDQTGNSIIHFLQGLVIHKKNNSFTLCVPMFYFVCPKNMVKNKKIDPWLWLFLNKKIKNVYSMVRFLFYILVQIESIQVHELLIASNGRKVRAPGCLYISFLCIAHTTQIYNNTNKQKRARPLLPRSS